MKLFIIVIAAISIIGCGQTAQTQTSKEDSTKFKVMKTNEEWKKELTPEQFSVLREKGTERPFTGKYNDFNEVGIYECAACGTDLFRSDTKFDAGCGWPSFFEAIDSSRIIYHKDTSLGMERVEIMCKTCGGHLGHVFDDGPPPTGKRYCLNSVSMNFKRGK